MDRWLVDNDPSTTYPIYTRGNIGEVFPLPVTPLSWTFAAIPCSEAGWRDAFARYGAFDADEFSEGIEILGCFGGYGYLNVSISRIFGVRTPGLTPEQVDYSIWGDMAGVPVYKALPTDESASHAERIQQTVGWILSAPELTELIDDRRKMAELRAARPDFTALSNEEILAHQRGLMPEFRRLFAAHLFVTYCALVPVGIIAGVCQALGDATLPMRLCAGLGDVDSAAPSTTLWDLGRLVAGSTELSSLFEGGVVGLLDRLRSAPGGAARAFVDQFDQFLYDYGSRGPNEWETSSPSWETDPELALAAIDRMRLSPASAAPAEQHDRLAADREALGGQLVDQLAGDPDTQAQFAAALPAAKVFLPGRERSKTNVIRLVNELRIAWNELGRRMVAEGVIARPQDLSMLQADELDGFLATPGSFSALIAERAADYATLFDLEPPFVIVDSVPPLREWSHRDRSPGIVAAGTTLPGIPGCPGVARGRARVILDPSDPRALEPGDVLVAPITDPAWTPLFVPAAAVVVDVGAQMSHAVIVSRELGIPCVVSVTDGTRKIADGAMLEVDGTAGTVKVL
ncbi:MAG TPA: PEP-utilizing enzyme [Acidimicrobiales bacterium]|nr:PEP-utilizing enzyme [Acidimicrobiales bacterium]